MTISQMLSQSGLLTLLGMCVVFGFIVILILCMKLLQIVVHALKLDKDKEQKQKVDNSSQNIPKNDDEKIIAAISVAIHDKVLKL